MGTPLHFSGDGASQDEPSLSSVEFTWTIKGQQERRIWGTTASQQDEEPLIGVIGFDGVTIVVQDSPGVARAMLVDEDTMELMYSHSTNDSMVAAVARFKRRT
jgi:hypothetical protein